MKIENNEANQQLKRLENQVRSKIAQKENDLQAMDAFYKKKAQDIKSEGIGQTIRARENNQQQLMLAADEYQKTIDDYSTSIKETNERLEKEQELLKLNQEDRLRSSDNEFQLFAAKKRDQNQDYIRDFDLETETDLNKMTSKANIAIQKQTRDVKNLVNKRAYDNENKIKDAEKNYEEKLRVTKNEYKDMATNATLEQRDHLNELVANQTKEFKELEYGHKFKMDNSREHFQSLMQQSSSSYNKKYKDMIENQQAVLARLKKQFSKEINELVDQNSSYKNIVSKKIQNEFYQLTKIDPQINEYEKSYVISIEIPDYEKDNVTLHANNKDLSISINRRYDNKVEAEDGSTNESKRSEIITKKFSVESLVNNKKIDQKYEDGILYFRIFKA